MESKTTFVPVLSISNGITDIDYYKKAFGAIELWRINNPDGSVHVAAFEINGAMFRLHEEGHEDFSPGKAGGTTVTIGLTADDVHAVVEQVVAAGATLLSPVIDYEYGYRQGEIKDPFGHHWIIEKLLNKEALDSFVKGAS
jgi:PhnB protein